MRSERARFFYPTVSCEGLLFNRFRWNLRVKAISETADAADERSGFVGFDLLPQAQDVDVHGAIRDGAIVSPHRIEQLLAAEDDARTAHQEFQKTKFGSGERKLLARKVHSAAGAI